MLNQVVSKLLTRPGSRTQVLPVAVPVSTTLDAFRGAVNFTTVHDPRRRPALTRRGLAWVPETASIGREPLDRRTSSMVVAVWAAAFRFAAQGEA